jgi:hypothetical protein
MIIYTSLVDAVVDNQGMLIRRSSIDAIPNWTAGRRAAG